MFIQLKKFQNDIQSLIDDCFDISRAMPLARDGGYTSNTEELMETLYKIQTIIDNAPDILLQKAGD